MKPWLIALTALFFTVAASCLKGGVARYYSFDYGTQAYTAITGTTINFTYTDDDLSGTLDIGFPFPYCGAVHTQLKVSTNGFINPGATWPYHSSNNQLQYGIYPIIAPLWDNLSISGGNVQYLLAGEAPNRSFTVQFYHARWPNNTTTSWVDFQAVLHESGLIEFIYGNHGGNPAPGSASIGINMPNAGSGNYFSVTPGDPPTVSTTQENYSINAHIPTGTVYRFVPLPPVLYDLTVTSVVPVNYNGMFYDRNTPFTLPVTVANNATQLAENYDVALYCGGTELARTSGILLEPGQSQVFDLVAEIDSSGYKTLTAKAELANDEYPGDNSRNFVCIIRPDPATGIIFGSGDENVRIPFDFYWRYSLYETLYYPAEIGATGMIYGISFFNNFQTNNFGSNLRLWVGETDNADLAEGWIPATQLTQVLDTDILFPGLQNEVYLPFSTPFHYIGRNLVLMAYQYNTCYTSGLDYFRVQTLDGLRALNRYSDAYNPDPNNPPAYNSLYGKVPMTAFYLSPASAVQDEVIPAIPLLESYPNPFSSVTTFFCKGLDKASPAIDIYNLKGQKVRSLKAGETVWDGCSEDGKQLAAGIYFAKSIINNKQVIRKLCKK